MRPLLSRYPCIFSYSTEFSGKRENAVQTNERLQQEALAVLNVIENPEVAQALRQDKNQNLQYLKEHYGVCPIRFHGMPSLHVVTGRTDAFCIGHS